MSSEKTLTSTKLLLFLLAFVCCFPGPDTVVYLAIVRDGIKGGQRFSCVFPRQIKGDQTFTRVEKFKRQLSLCPLFFSITCPNFAGSREGPWACAENYQPPFLLEPKSSSLKWRICIFCLRSMRRWYFVQLLICGFGGLYCLDC